MVKNPEKYRVLEQNSLWRAWGPYLAYRQWGTVREDYSPDGSCWEYFSHEQSRSRAYRWGEDGLFGISDINCWLCLSPTFWNHRDSILKERLFGLTGPEGNNGEDVKECYFHLAATPSHSYMKFLYRYPQNPFPYPQLIEENKKRAQGVPEFELTDTGIFDRNEYFDIYVEYAKANPEDILIRITVENKANHPAPLYVLPTIWFRNTWSWGRLGDAYPAKPRLSLTKREWIQAHHSNLQVMCFTADSSHGHNIPLFTENETDYELLFNLENPYPFVKNSFHKFIIEQDRRAVNPMPFGTKACFLSKAVIRAQASKVFKYRLFSEAESCEDPFDEDFDAIFEKRINETRQYYDALLPSSLSAEEKEVSVRAYSGLILTKQFYFFALKEWRQGDPSQPPPDSNRGKIRNVGWDHLYNRDILSMPDKWEYPWFAAWDTAFHMIPFARLDPIFTKHQLLLFLREWYLHPNGQIPAYEFAFSDVNPPVHAWACWRVYKMTAPRGQRDRTFLARAFHKLLLNFTWWVNQKDLRGNNLFSGGFLGLDNIGVFDRSAPLPEGQYLEQADATAWMAFYSTTMLSMALELASQDPSYSDIASKFFEHFVAISDAINRYGGSGLWNETDGFYYDKLHTKDGASSIRVRTLVGILPIIAVIVLDEEFIQHLPAFRKRMLWFLENRKDIAQNVSYKRAKGDRDMRLLSILTKERLERMLLRIFDEEEFLSPFGIRSLSKIHSQFPYELATEAGLSRVEYNPGESNTTMFGGNSNWRGPIWFPVNFLIIEALERYHYFYGDDFTIEFPTGSGVRMNLLQISKNISGRLAKLFLRNDAGNIPCLGDHHLFSNNQDWKDNIFFHEYFHGDTGRGLGACHQTGWTALVTQCLERIAK
jgi:hypothetical protein